MQMITQNVYGTWNLGFLSFQISIVVSHSLSPMCLVFKRAASSPHRNNVKNKWMFSIYCSVANACLTHETPWTSAH